MEKPVILTIEETKTKIVDIINDCKIPMYLLEPVIRDIHAEVAQVAKVEFDQTKKQYEESIVKEK